MNHDIQRRTWLKCGLATLAGAPVGIGHSALGQAARKSPTHHDTLALADHGKKIPIIFDTDIGGDIDDTWALLLALKCPELDVRLVTTDAGNTTGRARLAAKLLEAWGRTDIPVGIGIPPGNTRLNQSPWVGGYTLDRYPGKVEEDGVGAIIRTIKESLEPVTVVAIGGVPNIAAALERDPSIVNNARFVGMHGSIRVGYGGSNQPVAEANVRANPKALAKVFAAPWECTITPLDTCGSVQLTGESYQRVYRHESQAIRTLIDNYRIWIPNARWFQQPQDYYQRASSTLFDTVAVYLAFAEDLVRMETLPIKVTAEGMTVVDPDQRTVRCATRWNDAKAYDELLIQRLLG